MTDDNLSLIKLKYLQNSFLKAYIQESSDLLSEVYDLTSDNNTKARTLLSSYTLFEQAMDLVFDSNKNIYLRDFSKIMAASVLGDFRLFLEDVANFFKKISLNEEVEDDDVQISIAFKRMFTDTGRLVNVLLNNSTVEFMQALFKNQDDSSSLKVIWKFLLPAEKKEIITFCELNNYNYPEKN